jgi:hypothetical protein
MLNIHKIFKHMLFNKIIFAFIFFIPSCFSSPAQELKISGYDVFFAAGISNSDSIIIIRKYQYGGHLSYIGINPFSLETHTFSADKVKITPMSWNGIVKKFAQTPYVKALANSKSVCNSIQNAGITHGYPKEHGVSLTIDLCPSHKPFDRSIITSILSEFEPEEKPVPLALSITGRFMLTHEADMKWIGQKIDSGEISVTWVNHSFNHFYNPNIPLKENFLLEPGTNIRDEIVNTEIALLEHGFLFSVFFRFPGLVSDPAVFDNVTGYGLIPVGSDAWLAKNQQVHNGSIVLIHGNGNETVGINDFKKLLRQEKSAVMKKQWLLFDLRESVEEEFQ